MKIIDWIFSTKCGKFIFITLFGTILGLSILIYMPNLTTIHATIGMIIVCSLTGLIMAWKDKSLKTWF